MGPGVLITPRGGSYFLYANGLDDAIKHDIPIGKDERVPLFLYFKDDSGQQYVTDTLLWIRRSKHGIDIQTQTIGVSREHWQ